MDVFRVADAPTTEIDRLHGRLIDLSRNSSTLLIDLEAGARVARPGLEVFVLEGTVETADRRLTPLDFALLEGPCTATMPTRLVAWVPRADHLGVPRVQPAAAAGWRQPALGSAPGMLFRPLRAEDRVDQLGGKHVTGSEVGFRRLTLLAPGWFERRREVHAECREENILLAGDLMVCGQGRGAMVPGSVLVNETGLRHGPMATRGGAVLLISCDGWMSVEWSEAKAADVHALELYLAPGPRWL